MLQTELTLGSSDRCGYRPGREGGCEDVMEGGGEGGPVVSEGVRV